MKIKLIEHEYAFVIPTKTESAVCYGKTFVDKTGQTVLKLIRYSDKINGELTIPNSLTLNGTLYYVREIGPGAFRGCMGLTSISIPNSVTKIGYNAF